MKEWLLILGMGNVNVSKFLKKKKIVWANLKIKISTAQADKEFVKGKE